MAYKKEKLAVREKIGYSLGDFSANLIFQTLIVFQMSFYTDVFGISAAAAGTLFLVVRFSDAITDPLMGIIADRTNTKWGKFRPWVLWSAFPLGIMAVVTFTTPDLGYTGKLVYAFITYTVLMMVYTVSNLPYSALSGVMTGDPVERTSLSSYRFVAMTTAAVLIQGLLLPMVNYFGGGDDQLGYQITMSIFAVLLIICLIITFYSTKERVTPSQKQQTSVKQDLKDLTMNGPWIALFTATIFIFITLSMRGSTMPYYFTYYVGDSSILGFSMGSDTLLSYFLVSGLLATVVGIVMAKPMAAWFGKREVFVIALIITALLNMSFLFYAPGQVELMFLAEILRQLAYGFTIPLLWAMMGDVADYSEWKFRRRATGVVFSGTVFGLKSGLGFGGALTGWFLSLYGYVPNVEQTDTAIHGIVMTASIFSGLSFLIAAGILVFYRINRQMETEITDELERRRNNENEED